MTRPSPTKHTALAVMLSLLAATVAAQAPDAGSTLRDLQQTRDLELPVDPGPLVRLPEPDQRAQLPADLRLRVAQFAVTGNTALDSATLLALLDDLRGRELTMDELYSAADRLTAAYQARGYLLSRAYLPAQEIEQGGTVTVAVLEGRYGQVRVENSSLIADAALQRYLEPIDTAGIVDAGPLERQLLLVDDLPGVAIQTALSAGAEQGQSDLTLLAGGEPRTSGSLSLDNHGSRHTGQNRLSVRATVASPLGRGDLLDMSLLYSDEDQLFYQLRYDAPLGIGGTGFGVTATRMNYALAGDFANLNASGTAETLGLNLRHAWLRGRTLNLRSDLGFERRELEDKVSNGLLVTRKRAEDLGIGISGDWRSSTSISAFSLRWVSGDLTLRSGQFPPDAPRGRFDRWQFSLLRLQNLSDTLTLYASVQGQFAGENLDSSEKMMLGGAQGVRAYPLGEGSADEAALVNLELRYRVSATTQVRLLADGAYARLLHDPFAPGDNYRKLGSFGAGFDWFGSQGLQVSLVAARRGGEVPQSDRDRSWRVWGQLQWSF